jgi:hypothetical protein
MKVRAQDREVLANKAWEVFEAAHASAPSDKEMSEAWTAYTSTMAAIGPAWGRTKGPKLPERVARAQAEAYYRRLQDEVRRAGQDSTTRGGSEDSHDESTVGSASPSMEIQRGVAIDEFR